MTEFLQADGLDKAFVGLGYVCGRKVVAVYDAQLVILILMDSGMTEEEAEEHFEFNIAGAFVGEQTPLFLRRCSLDQAVDDGR